MKLDTKIILEPKKLDTSSSESQNLLVPIKIGYLIDIPYASRNLTSRYLLNILSDTTIQASFKAIRLYRSNFGLELLGFVV